MKAQAQTLNELAAALNRPMVYLAGLQKRFELPMLAGAGYSSAYSAFLRSVLALRTHNVAEETLRDLWHLEMKLLQLLHVDSTGSATWFLDACGQTTEPRRRLLLTNYNLGFELNGREMQPGLNFSETTPELFAGKELGEDALRMLREYLKLHTRISSEVRAERPHVRAALEWARRLR